MVLNNLPNLVTYSPTYGEGVTLSSDEKLLILYIPYVLLHAVQVCPYLPQILLGTQETKDPHICFPIWGESSTGLSVPWY